MNIEQCLRDSLENVQQSVVKDAMMYSLMAGGKRIRPNLLFRTLEGYGMDPNEGKYFACAIEMIHTYSLIHDDLPAMDNDDLRRGRKTCHKQFNEACAILAGDGLLTYAFEYASQSTQEPKTVIKCIQLLAKSAGASGMVYGQCLDMEETDTLTYPELLEIHHHKTGCLLSVPLMIGAVLAGQSEQVISKWETIGLNLGLAFQIQDDLLDISKTSEELGKTNSDVRNHKMTSVNLLGQNQAEQMKAELFQGVKDDLKQIGGFDSTALLALIEQVEKRSK